jgi:AcrR family transcriptional regulator
MPRSEEQFEKIRNQKTKLIMDTALELFAEKGFHATSMSQVAEKAGISKGLAYNYFKSKQEILDSIIKTGFDSVYANFDLNHDGILTEDEFRHFIRETIGMVFENRIFWKLFLSLMLKEGHAEAAIGKYSNANDVIISMLKRFIAFRGTSNTEESLMSVSFILKGAFLIAVTSPEMSDPGIFTEMVINACMKQIST